MRVFLNWLTILFAPVCEAASTGAPVAAVGYETWCALEPDLKSADDARA